MGDRTAYNAIIYACPTDQQPALLEALTDQRLHAHFGFSADSELELGVTYGNGERSVGDTDEIFNAIREAAPDATFEVWEDPRYEWLGDLRQYAPGLGEFAAECDANGTPQFTSAEIQGAVEKGALTPEFLGVPWRDLFESLRKEGGSQ